MGSSIGTDLGLVDEPYKFISIGKNSVSIFIGVVVDGETPIAGSGHSGNKSELWSGDIITCGPKLCREQKFRWELSDK